MDKQALEEVDCEKDLGVNVCQWFKGIGSLQRSLLQGQPYAGANEQDN